MWSLIYILMYWLKRVVYYLGAVFNLALLVTVILAIPSWISWTWVWYSLSAVIADFVLYGLILISAIVIVPRMRREQHSRKKL